MGRKKYNTEEERLEARRISKAKFNANNPEKLQEYQAQHYAKLKDKFCAYLHIGEGVVYVGSGNLQRPKHFTNRLTHWREAFPKRPIVKIVKEFTDRKEAYTYEYGFMKHLKEEGYNLANKQFKR